MGTYSMQSKDMDWIIEQAKRAEILERELAAAQAWNEASKDQILRASEWSTLANERAKRIAELEPDAERYRFLRESIELDNTVFSSAVLGEAREQMLLQLQSAKTEQIIDAAIDAARAKEKDR